MHPTHDELVLHYYGESGDDTARLDLHLASCAECRGALQRLQQALALVEASGEGEPGPGYEATMWARLQHQLETPAPWWQHLWRGGVGYSDNTGPEKSNLALSQARADAVRQAIIARGIDAGRLSAEGYGSAHPVADNATAEGQQKNRRISARLTAK